MQFEIFFPIFFSRSLSFLDSFDDNRNDARPSYLGCKCQLTGDTRGSGLACVPATWDANLPEKDSIFLA